jgi:hypothetical protein
MQGDLTGISGTHVEDLLHAWIQAGSYDKTMNSFDVKNTGRPLLSLQVLRLLEYRWY